MTRKVDHEFCSQDFDLEIFVLEILLSSGFGLMGLETLILALKSVSQSEIECKVSIKKPILSVGFQLVHIQNCSQNFSLEVGTFGQFDP